MKKTRTPEERAAAILDTLSKEELIEFFVQAGFEMSEGTGMILNAKNEVVFDPNHTKKRQ